MRYMILHDRERDEGGEKEMALQGSQTRKRDFDVFLYRPSGYNTRLASTFLLVVQRFVGLMTGPRHFRYWICCQVSITACLCHAAMKHTFHTLAPIFRASLKTCLFIHYNFSRFFCCWWICLQRSRCLCLWRTLNVCRKHSLIKYVISLQISGVRRCLLYSRSTPTTIT